MSETAVSTQVELLLPTFKVDIGNLENQYLGREVSVKSEAGEGTGAATVSKFVSEDVMSGVVELTCMKASKACLKAPMGNNT